MLAGPKEGDEGDFWRGARCCVLRELGESYRRRAAWMVRWSETLSLLFQASALACALVLVVVSRFQRCSSDVMFAMGVLQVFLGGLQALVDKLIPLRATVETGRKAEQLLAESKQPGTPSFEPVALSSVGGQGADSGASIPPTKKQLGGWDRIRARFLFAPSREAQLWNTLRAYDSQRDIPPYPTTTGEQV